MRARHAEILASCSSAKQFPAESDPEFAFLGRSNVGKSSLLNALVGRRQLARTSSTPGKTRLIHFYSVEIGDATLRLVDLPGYGWAKVSHSERNRWQNLIEGYLAKREVLRAAILLQDIRRDVSDDETLLLEWLAEQGIESLVAITKTDKLKAMKRKARLAELKRDLPLAKASILSTSATKGDGLADLWRALYSRIDS